ncbi:hypothetical protein BH09SUM1_BH09SUM1_16480 [soil metagenome]
MTRRKKLFLRIILALGLGFVALAGLWGYAAFRPSGIGELERMVKAADAARPPVPPRAPYRPAAAPAAPDLPPLDPDVAASDNTPAKRSLRKLLLSLENVRSKSVSMYAYGGNGMGWPGYLSADDVVSSGTWAERRAVHVRSLNASPPFQRDDAAPGLPWNREDRTELNRGLDRFEAALFEPLPDGSMIASSSIFADRHNDMKTGIRLSLVRACVQGDSLKAAALLDVYEEAFDRSYPEHEVSDADLGGDCVALLMLGQIDSTPRFVFERMGGILVRQHLDEKAAEIYRARYALQLRAEIAEQIWEEPAPETTVLPQYIGSGYFALKRALLAPVSMNEIDQVITAWKEKDGVGVRRHYLLARGANDIMGVSVDLWYQLGHRPFINDMSEIDYAPETALQRDIHPMLNDQGHFKRFILSCAFHRWAHSRWPESVADLTDEDRNLTSMGALNDTWEIRNVSEVRGPALYVPIAAVSPDPADWFFFHDRVTDFWWKRHRMPVSAAEVYEGIPGADLWHPPAPGFGMEGADPTNGYEERGFLEKPEEMEKFFKDFDAFPLFLAYQADYLNYHPRLRQRSAWPDATMTGGLMQWLFSTPEPK